MNAGKDSGKHSSNRITIVSSKPRYAQQMEDLMHAVYHTTPDDPDQVFTAPMFRRHMQVFPEGQFVALDAGHVVGLTVSMRVAFDPEHPFLGEWWTLIGEGWLTTHNPNGEWMYGVESVVHPDYRGQGVGGKLMDARYDTAKALNMRGMVAGSALIDYYRVADTVTVEDYIAGVVEGRYFDTNLSKQIKKGFRPIAPIPNYVNDPETLGWGAVIVWDNPLYDPMKQAGVVTPRRYRMKRHAPYANPINTPPTFPTAS